MDQGVAGVWAAGVAGLTGAAGVALGAGLAGKSARFQVIDQGMLERARRLEEHRREIYTGFHDHLTAAIQALDAFESGVQEGKDCQAEERLVSSTLSTALASTITVRTCGPEAVTEAAHTACIAVKDAAEAVRAMRHRPDQDQTYDRWQQERLRVSISHGLFADAFRVTVNGFD
ncbi:hypothetical protein [Streptomyces xinghaiensis]|uniref:hypothetical protein n=1 Tax=Streptomyces xinghaiensis TaxID=1038928 RepID=UPI0034128D80